LLFQEEKLKAKLADIRLRFAHDESITVLVDNVQTAFQLLHGKVRQSTSILEEQQAIIEKTLTAICKEQGEVSQKTNSNWTETALVVGIPIAMCALFMYRFWSTGSGGAAVRKGGKLDTTGAFKASSGASRRFLFF